MLFKNLDTGLIWEVLDPDHIKRCQASKNYEEVNEVKQTKKIEQQEQSEIPKKSTRTKKTNKK